MLLWDVRGTESCKSLAPLTPLRFGCATQATKNGNSSGYAVGVVSPTNVIFNNGAQDASIEAAGAAQTLSLCSFYGTPGYSQASPLSFGVFGTHKGGGLDACTVRSLVQCLQCHTGSAIKKPGLMLIYASQEPRARQSLWPPVPLCSCTLYR